jgi:hypothetical protein
MPKVFSIDDFRRGLDTRRTALTAPAGSLRILENALLNPGGEIQKRFAFVQFGHATMPWTMIGQYQTLHVFGCPIAPVFTGLPVPCVSHDLEYPGEPILYFTDVETFGGSGFQVTGNSATRNYVWYNGLLVHDFGGALSFGTYSRTYKTKMYRTNGYYLNFSGVGDPAVQDPASTTNPGAGFINMAQNDPDAEPVEALEVFYSNMAVFSRLATQIWTLDPDPTKDALQQVIRVGTIAPQSVHQLYTGDILFYSDSGVRSLKTLSGINVAGVSDVGAAIDLILMPIARDNPALARSACAMVQPSFGRYWLHVNGVIYVLSYFPAGDITAWSTFIPGFDVWSFAVIGSDIAVQSTAGDLYFYGGANRNTYDSSKVTVRTPHLDNKAPTENKRIKSIDVMCEGAWSVSAGMLPNNLNAFELVANISNNTFGLQSIPFAGYGTHFGFELTHEAPGPASLAAIHVNILEAYTK